MAVQDIKLPEVGENIESGTIVKISVSVGDSVKKDQELLELETDKASLPVPAPSDGVIKEILVKEGQDVKIGASIMKLDTDGQKAEAEEKDAEQKPKQETNEEEKTEETEDKKQETNDKKQEKTQKPKTEESQPQQTQQPAQQDSSSTAKNIAAAPSVRRLARELGVNISQVPGTGPRGRISKDDIKGYAKGIIQSGGAAAGKAAPAARPLPDFSKWGNVHREKMNNIRKKTAEHMTYCWSNIPHVSQFGKADITDLEKLRKRYSKPDRKLTVTPFLLKVMATAMKHFKQFNASIDTSGQEIIYKDYIHIGVAVDTEKGLIVPVIRDVDKKSILEISDELNETAERVRAGKITLDELQGGSMTLTNLGGIGGTAFTPIVNWPEVAILGVSRGAYEPVYENNHFVPRFMLPLCLSYDHRVIDGADGARFLRWVCEAIEQPFLMELEG